MNLINNIYDPYDEYKIALTTKKIITKHKIRYLLYTIINLLGSTLTIKNTNLIVFNDKNKFDILIFTDNITYIMKKILPIIDEIQAVITKKLGNKVKFKKKGLKIKKDIITLCCNENDKCFLNGYEFFLFFDKDILLYIKIIESFVNVKPIVCNNNDNVKLLNVKGKYLFMNMYFTYIYINKKTNFCKLKNKLRKYCIENNLDITYVTLNKLYRKVFNCQGKLINFLEIISKNNK